MKIFWMVLFFTMVMSQAQASDKISGTPDFLQTSSKTLPTQGKKLCAPVAVANSLMWLADNGYPRLHDRTSNSQYENQVKLIRELCAVDLMGISGTSPEKLLNAIDQYVSSRGYDIAELSYQGWRPHPDKYAGGSRQPQPEWIAESVKDKGVAWLNVGWYRYDAGRNVYQRIGGHWITLVGTRQEGRDLVLIAHDPASRAGKTFANEEIRLEPIPSGTLEGTKKNLPFPAKGLYALTGGMHVKKTADFAILDGVVRLRLKEA